MLNKTSWFLLPVLLLAVMLAFANKHPSQVPVMGMGAEDKSTRHAVAEPTFTKGESLPGSFLAARMAEQLNDHERAIAHARHALKADSTNPMLKQQLYHLLLINGNVEEAIHMGLVEKKAIKHRSLSPEVLLAIADVKAQRYQNAVKSLEGAGGNSLNEIMAPITQTWAKIAAGQIHTPISANQMMRGVSKVDAPFIQYHLALMNDVLGHEKEAALYYAGATKDLDKVPFRIVELAVNFYRRTGEKALAKRLVDAYTLKNPTLPFEVASEQAGKVIPRIVKNASDGIAELLYSMGSVLYGVNAIEDETIYLQLALYLRPEFSVAHYLLGNGYEATKQYHRAQAAYDKINPNSPLFLRGKLRSAQMEQVQGNIKEALLQIENVAKRFPLEQDVFLSKGDMLRNAGRFDESAQAYSVVIDRIKTPAREHWSMFYARGIAYERAGKWEKAEQDFHRALTLEPNQPDVMNYLGYSWLVMNKHPRQAKILIEKALELRPDDVHIIDSMGFALYTFGEFERALEFYEQAIERAPADATVNDHLGDVYWRLGRKREAQFQWERALLFDPEPAMERAIRDKLKSGLPVFVPPVDKLSAEASKQKIQ